MKNIGNATGGAIEGGKVGNERGERMLTKLKSDQGRIFNLFHYAE